MNISFRLKPGRDDDVISWICNIGKDDRSYFIREAIKFFIKNGGSELCAVLKTPTSPVSQSQNCTGAISEEHEMNNNKNETRDKDLDSALKNWIDSV
jgi:hypothetical protein